VSVLVLGCAAAALICTRLRQVDVKAEHFERQVQRSEQERDEWERKHGVSCIYDQYIHWALK
jgi:hypothetical protein